MLASIARFREQINKVGVRIPSRRVPITSITLQGPPAANSTLFLHAQLFLAVAHGVHVRTLDLDDCCLLACTRKQLINKIE
jgi:hypothetical protein